MFAQYSRPQTLDLDQATSLMQQHLPKGSVVSFWQDGELNDSYLAFVMSADGKVVTQRIKKDNLKRSLQAYREITAFHGSVIDYMKETRKTLWRHADGSFEVSASMPAQLTFKDRVMHIESLQAYISDSLLGPIWSNIAEAKSLLISPDSDLALVAFEALTTPNGKRLIEEKDISYTPSLSIWINTHQRQASYNQQQRLSLLALANPDYSQQQSDQKAANSSLPMITQRGQTVQRDQLFWVDLPGTEIEAKRIASIYPDLTLKTGKDASKHWLVEQNQTGTLKQYKQLHFATHGYLDDSDPMQSSLVLSFDQGKAQAYLSAQDIYKLDLQSDLTVLSACNTAANEAKAGVGVVGLPFALYMAGNQSTLMTLWSVDDKVTAAYMQRFYELVKEGVKPAQANSQVKREFITQTKYAGVNIWAPFVYYGI
ncbi:CHAT domain-containing protein [Thiosulfativibrio zosterae]|uniref:CHAT domain-containing protein n=1 Tax=Thiosulfativibrio zosterae TaxID=2675053 RepID=A0A6F8PQW6_9GAMM|nr:CHAT domain-containing protein [Thiosulfativibrio zosterae]BBP44522.1 hypothetical protein THMIRHAT_22680 [Thiosulfativibrio zosterae]